MLDVEDSANMFFGFKPSLGGGQLIGTLSIDFIRHDPTRKCIAIGEKGTLCWDGLLEQVAFYGEGSSGWKILKKVANDLEGSYRAEWMSFLDSIRLQKEPMVTINDGVEVLRLIENCRLKS